MATAARKQQIAGKNLRNAQCPSSVRNASSSPYSEPQRHSSLLLCHRAFKEAFKEAVQRSGSATLSPVTLHSAALYTVHGYARVHTSIYIYIYIYIYLYIIYVLERLHNGSCFGSGVFAWSGGAAPCVERVWL